jgi:metal-responsive CopG/Arc/MetJ family transcriptional regulator
VTEPDETMGGRAPGDVMPGRQDEGDPQGVRPSAMQAISARLPAALVEELNDEAARRGIRPSELVRQAVESLLRGESDTTADLNASVGCQMTVMTPLGQYHTENANLVVEVYTEPNQMVALD